MKITTVVNSNISACRIPIANMNFLSHIRDTPSNIVRIAEISATSNLVSAGKSGLRSTRYSTTTDTPSNRVIIDLTSMKL